MNHRKNFFRKFAIISTIGLLVAFDLLLKYFFEQAMESSAYIPLIGEFLGLKLSYNSGIAFSLPIRGIFLEIVTGVVLSGLVWYYIKNEYQRESTCIDIAYILIISGAISHAYERIFFGYVVDFISVKYFAILNFADIFISVGAILLSIAYARRR